MTMGELSERRLLGAAEIDRAVRGIAAEILGRYPPGGGVPRFVGIFKRGVTLAERVRAVLADEYGAIPMGTLDINLYRDDLDNLGTLPTLRSSDIPFEVTGARVILFDDVLFTGRTTRAAIGGIMDYGRPAKLELAVLIDRGNRELPIQADYVGCTHATRRDEYVRVRFVETDGEDAIELLREKGERGEQGRP
ncbi:bifunctional pyr operon transcriptional regulator/uracil phosphoribosyltransferase PyrR [soil metagenome]